MTPTLSEKDIIAGSLAGSFIPTKSSRVPPVVFDASSFERARPSLPEQMLYGASLHPLLRIVRAIRVHFERREDGFVAIVPELEEFGMGSTTSDALDDLRHTLAELYFSLARDEDRLSESLREVWHLLTTHVVLTRQ